MKIKYSNESIE